MKCQTLFSGKNKKNILRSCLLLNFLYALLKNRTYYVTGYGVRPSVNFFVSG